MDARDYASIPSNKSENLFVLCFFPDLAQEGVEKAEAQAYQDNVCDRVKRWIDEKTLPTKIYIKRAYHPRPWR